MAKKPSQNKQKVHAEYCRECGKMFKDLKSLHAHKTRDKCTVIVHPFKDSQKDGGGTQTDRDQQQKINTMKRSESLNRSPPKRDSTTHKLVSSKSNQNFFQSNAGKDVAMISVYPISERQKPKLTDVEPTGFVDDTQDSKQQQQQQQQRIIKLKPRDSIVVVENQSSEYNAQQPLAFGTGKLIDNMMQPRKATFERVQYKKITDLKQIPLQEKVLSHESMTDDSKDSPARGGSLKVLHRTIDNTYTASTVQTPSTVEDDQIILIKREVEENADPMAGIFPPNFDPAKHYKVKNTEPLPPPTTPEDEIQILRDSRFLPPLITPEEDNVILHGNVNRRRMQVPPKTSEILLQPEALVEKQTIYNPRRRISTEMEKALVTNPLELSLMSLPTRGETASMPSKTTTRDKFCCVFL